VSDNSKKNNAAPVTAEPVEEKENSSAFASELEELKRDMRSAKVIDWMQQNQQQLIAAGVALLLVLAGGSLWMERNKAQTESAAALYHQGIAASDAGKQRELLEMVTKDYAGSGYAALAHLYLAKLVEDPVEHLNALIHSGSTPELAWQARLDLAEWFISKGQNSDASAQLAEPVGRQYEQLRYYLLAEVADSADDKRQNLQMSLDAESNDSLLKDRVEKLLSELDTDATPES